MPVSKKPMPFSFCYDRRNGGAELNISDSHLRHLTLSPSVFLYSPWLLPPAKSDSSPLLSLSTSPHFCLSNTIQMANQAVHHGNICQVCPPSMKGDKKDKNFLIEPSHRVLRCCKSLQVFLSTIELHTFHINFKL